MRIFFRHLKNHFINGLILLVPAFITLTILYKAFGFVYSIMDFGVALIPGKYRSIPFINQLITAGTIVLTVLFVWFLGIMVKTYLGRILRGHLHNFIGAIPFAGSIFRAFRQLMDIAFSSAPRTFSRVVLIDFPYRGSKSIGFITGNASERIMTRGADGSLRESYKVFVPGTPNLASGFLLIIPKEEVTMTNLGVEQGFLSVVSGGILKQQTENDG